jgi:hypothetical protein
MSILQATDAARVVVSEDHSPPALPGARRTLIAVILGACLLLAAIAAQQLRAAHAALLAGGHDLAIPHLTLQIPSLAAHPGRVAGLRRQVAAAEASFSDARAELAPWAPLLDHVGWLPRIGSEISAAVPAADTGYHATRSALALLDGLRPLTATLSQSRGGGRLRLVARSLASSAPLFRQASIEADAAASDASRLPSSLGSPHLDSLLSRLHRQLPMLRSGAHLLAQAPSLLGVDRPAHYLFAWENPAELRATGGFIGAVDYITVRAGVITHQFHGHLLPHEITTAGLPLPEAMYTPEDYLLLCDSNWSPDFSLSARLERWFYGEDTGNWADAVINFVDSGVSPLLQATGPLYLPGYHRWVTANNAQSLAQQYINGQYKGPQTTGLPDTVRKQFFHAVLLALVSHLERTPLSSLPSLISALQGLTRHRDLLLYARRPSVEAEIVQAGAAGLLQPVPGDFLMVVDDNRSYNKINPYVVETGAYTASVKSTGAIDATLTLRYTLRSSPANLEGKGPYWGKWGTKHDYQDFLRVYVPAGAQLGSLTGVVPWAPEPAYGLRQFAGRLLVREGHTVVVTLRYTTPPSALSTLDSPMYRLTVQRQAGADLKALAVLVTRSGSGPTFRANLPLASDARVQIPMPGLHPPAVALTPASALDPYLGNTGLSDRRHPL